MVDVTGFWAGQFHYPNTAAPPVSFDCELTQTAHYLSGRTTEKAEGKRQSYFLISASLDGKIFGQNITFTKTYDSDEPSYIKIEYSGKVNPRGNEIKGVWKRPDWSGTFVMRKDNDETQQKRETTVANDIETVI